MALLRELGAAARQRRSDMGLTQQAVADLAGLSRATINELESGKLKDLSSTRIERVANELGFAVGVIGGRRRTDGGALEAAARVASVPYSSEMPAAVLADALRQGAVAPAYIPHLRTLLDEAPVAVLAGTADQLQRDSGIPQPETWAKMRRLAHVLKCDRPLWQRPSI